MQLFLASEATHPDSLKKLDNFVGGIEDKKIAYIPTAANGEGYGSWKNGDSIEVVKSLETKVSVMELEECINNDVKRLIDGADILWFAGGMAGYLMYWIRRVELDKALGELLDKGLIYVGSSAGSMIAAKTLYSAEWYIGDSEPGASMMSGLGLVDFEIYPHFEEKVLPELRRRWKQDKLYMLKDGEVITVMDGKIEVLGETRVIVGKNLL